MLSVAISIGTCEEFALDLDKDEALNQPCDDHTPKEVLALANSVTAHKEPEEYSSCADEEPDEDSKVPLSCLPHVSEIIDEEHFLSAYKEAN